jgi:hypothetical protein
MFVVAGVALAVQVLPKTLKVPGVEALSGVISNYVHQIASLKKYESDFKIA